MKNFHFGVITIVIGLVFTGTMTDPSGKSSMVLNSEYQWNEFLLTNGSTGKHEMPVDTLQTAATVDASSSIYGVPSQPPRNKEWRTRLLDLSNGLLWRVTLSPLTHLHASEILNLSNSAIRSISLDLPSPPFARAKHHRHSFQSGLSFVKVLILQRNILGDTPKGLWKLKSLQSLDLSFNEILQIGQSDFRNCLQLENLYLKSNRISSIHPEAFKDLKRLQVVDLSSNALTAIVPVMTIALHFPRLEVDLAGNQWQCDGSMAIFQTFISESWRKKWNVICDKSVGNKKAYLEIPKNRISREIHPPRLNLNQRESKAERPRGGMRTRLSTPGKEAPVDSNHRKMQEQLPRGTRISRDVRAAHRKDDSQDLVLAVCLSVFITFLVAFCLGAFTRPYMDRLWQQRCQKKSPGADNAYSNEGFYDEVEGVGRIHHPRTELSQAFHNANLSENQGPFLVTEPRSHAAVITDRFLGRNRKEPGRWQSSEQGRDNTGARRSNENAHLDGAVARFALCRPPDADKREVISAAARDHIYSNDALGELNYETVAQEYSPRERSMGVSAEVSTSPTLSGSTHRHLNGLDLSLSRGAMPSESTMLTYPNARQIAESKKIGSPEKSPLETMGSQVPFSKEMQVGTFTSLPGTQQPQPQGAHDEEEPSAIYSEVLRDADPPAPLPRWSSGLYPLPSNAPLQKDAPSDTQHGTESDFDSDEGSLFTLSSEGSEDASSMSEGEARGESSENPGLHEGNATSVEGPEDRGPFQKTLGEYETQDDHFGKPLIPGPDAGLYKTHLESASSNNKSGSPLTQPRSPGNSPSSEEIPGTFLHDYDIDLQSQVVEWQYSLKDLEFFNVNSLPQTPHSAEVPSDTEEKAWR